MVSILFLHFPPSSLAEITKFINYCQTLPRNRRPDYKYLKSLLTAIREGESLSKELEWFTQFKEDEAELAELQDIQ